jgi:hypothetical protein
MDSEQRAKISKSQRAGYERERQEQTRLRNALHDFALWLHPTWDAGNEDDVAAALAAVDAFLARKAVEE